MPGSHTHGGQGAQEVGAPISQGLYWGPGHYPQVSLRRVLIGAFKSSRHEFQEVTLCLGGSQCGISAQFMQRMRASDASQVGCMRLSHRE